MLIITVIIIVIFIDRRLHQLMMVMIMILVLIRGDYTTWARFREEQQRGFAHRTKVRNDYKYRYHRVVYDRYRGHNMICIRISIRHRDYRYTDIYKYRYHAGLSKIYHRWSNSYFNELHFIKSLQNSDHAAGK